MSRSEFQNFCQRSVSVGTLELLRKECRDRNSVTFPLRPYTGVRGQNTTPPAHTFACAPAGAFAQGGPRCGTPQYSGRRWHATAAAPHSTPGDWGVRVTTVAPCTPPGSGYNHQCIIRYFGARLGGQGEHATASSPPPRCEEGMSLRRAGGRGASATSPSAPSEEQAMASPQEDNRYAGHPPPNPPHTPHYNLAAW